MYDGPFESEDWLRALQWPGRQRFETAERVTLSRAVPTGGMGNRRSYGWMKRVDGLTWVVIAHASHMAPADQPEAALDMVHRWVDGTL